MTRLTHQPEQLKTMVETMSSLRTRYATQRLCEDLLDLLYDAT
ncbi:diglucosyl diacylglycerol synthase, partial [Staphylococcus agnetis]|nr:diglucosyl diacylglycerol synthase [Staphylococcus agnetis]